MPQSTSPRAYSWMFFAIALLICTCLFILARYEPPNPTHTFVGDDYPNTLPVSLQPKTIVTQEQDTRFSLHSDKDWNIMFPKPWNGFTSVGPENRVFAVAVYHQLHCLDIIRGVFVKNVNDLDEAAHHIEHCLRYLRETILCHADLTLESAFWTEDRYGNTIPGTEGVGVTHQCVDWDQLHDYMEAHPVILPPNATTGLGPPGAAQGELHQGHGGKIHEHKTGS
ncbi:hypothetical protein BXZ70DRAFT_909797 [Cristinia sonorae]|uniref:Oxidase ustYa n=1 Tax=Cristinia sonorae TaxID=1940300 RepID=A0A8K0XLL7_9AGAR|nr:hypothetical protein BXZ70DRAFT_909797 [Cristinia sonorae]